MSSGQRITAFAPASVGNVGVGFDMLGLALAGVGDHVTAERSEQPGISIVDIRGRPGIEVGEIPTAWQENSAAVAAHALWTAAEAEGGLQLSVFKGIPLKSGMGGSAASAVAGVVAANALLNEPLPRERLLEFALAGERVCSRASHADNVAPSLLGGLVFCPTTLLPQTVAVPMPEYIRCVLVHPDSEIATAESRLRLSHSVEMASWLEQQAAAVGFVLGCLRQDIELIGRSLRDVIIEPQRAASIPCFAGVKTAALENGALGCSISGSGPAIFALVIDSRAADVERSMRESAESQGFTCQSWVSSVNAPAAHIVTTR
jgi:homoserine kinase